MAEPSAELPIDSIRADFEAGLGQGSIVVFAPTGTGKSTQIPCWAAQLAPWNRNSSHDSTDLDDLSCVARRSQCADVARSSRLDCDANPSPTSARYFCSRGPGGDREKVLVVEPRRVACRSLAQYVASQLGTELGTTVGYSVRDDHRATEDTRILYATTGIVIQMLAGQGVTGLVGPNRFQTIVLDEVHERSLDIDLLLAVLFERAPSRLVVMSATLDGERVARHLGARLLKAEGRKYPITVQHVAGTALLPTIQGLEDRLIRALEAAREVSGDVLVFLPGKAEIRAASQALRGKPGLAVIPLHGGLSLGEQGRAFMPLRAGQGERKVILATNVAETSVTVPGVSVVIDSGLVRRTQYHRGRGFLTLVPIAEDSASQRAGRAGRTGPGWCFKLWSEAALLEPATSPEIHREGLAQLVLAARACKADVWSLPFLDPPKDYALEAAEDDLEALGALGQGCELSERGNELFGLPVDAPLGRLLIEAETVGCLPDAIDLVAGLATSRPLFQGPRRPEEDVEDDPRAGGCDALAMIRAVRGAPSRDGVVSSHVASEARTISRRLRQAFGLPLRSKPDEPVDRERLARTAIAADKRCVHVVRVRRGRAAYSNGGTELELARHSAVDHTKASAIAVIESRAIAAGPRKRRLIITCAAPVLDRWIVAAGLGTEHLRAVRLKAGRVRATIERIYAKRVLESREETPTGELARWALRDLFLTGRLYPRARDLTRDRLESWALLARLLGRGARPPAAAAAALSEVAGRGGKSLESWVDERLFELGVESGDDLSLMTEQDLLADELPRPVRDWLDRTYPRRLDLGDASYEIRYDLERGEVVLDKIKGSRKQPPPLSYLPPFVGFRVVVRDRNVTRVLKPRALTSGPW